VCIDSLLRVKRARGCSIARASLSQITQIEGLDEQEMSWMCTNIHVAPSELLNVIKRLEFNQFFHEFLYFDTIRTGSYKLYDNQV